MFSVVIPHYNNLQILKECLGPMINDQWLMTNGEIIIIDNNSTDESKEYLNKNQSSNINHQSFKVIFNNRNLGFAAAVNQGIEAAKYDWVVVMNNDLKVDKSWFLEIQKAIDNCLNNGTIVALFGKVLNWEGTEIESVGLNFDISGKSKNIGNGDSGVEKYSRKKFIWGAPASIAVYKKSVLKELGFFDNDFFAYLEDVDLSIRLRKMGFKTLYLPKAVSYHYGGETADKINNFREKYTARNWWYIIIKHYPVRIFILNLPKILFEQTKNFLAVKGLKSKFWVVKELLLNFRKLWKKRNPKKNLGF